MKAVLLCIAVGLIATACTPLDQAAIAPDRRANDACAAAAMAVVQDANADHYDATMQDVVYKDAYSSCKSRTSIAAGQ